MRAVWEEDEEKVEILLGAGCNLTMRNDEGETALHIAARVANAKLIQVWND